MFGGVSEINDLSWWYSHHVSVLAIRVAFPNFSREMSFFWCTWFINESKNPQRVFKTSLQRPLLKWLVLPFLSVKPNFVSQKLRHKLCETPSIRNYWSNFSDFELWLLRAVIAYVSHVCSQHSFGLPLRINGMHRTQYDHVRFGPSITCNLITCV